MPQWAWWLAGGLFAFWFDQRQQRISALQSVDVGLLLIKSETDSSANSTTGTTTISTADGTSITVESSVSSDLQSEIQALSKSSPASKWLAVAAALQASSAPIAANSVAAQGMNLIENGIIGAP